MSTTYMQVYEVPVYHLMPTVTWLHHHGIKYFTRMGLGGGLIQVAGSKQQLDAFQLLLRELWITKEHTTFPKKHHVLIQEELESWGISYRRVANPFAFEIETEIDQRKLALFVDAIRTLTKKNKKAAKTAAKAKAGIPDDASSLLD